MQRRKESWTAMLRWLVGLGRIKEGKKAKTERRGSWKRKVTLKKEEEEEEKEAASPSPLTASCTVSASPTPPHPTQASGVQLTPPLPHMYYVTFVFFFFNLPLYRHRKTFSQQTTNPSHSYRYSSLCSSSRFLLFV